VIPVAEIRALEAEWQLREDVIEKDYVLGWVLAGIAAEPALRTWVFKGGTALRKCYYETYRFSEDLDFTIVEGGPEAPEDLVPVFQRIVTWLYDRCGIELIVDETSFRRRENRRQRATTEGKVAYRGPRMPRNLPKLKLDLTTDEVVPSPTVDRQVFHPYSDTPDPPAIVRCYSIADLLAEKIRALVERCRPRDLYDVVNVHRHPDLTADHAADVRASLAKKCAHAGIAIPDRAAIEASPFRGEIEQEWSNMLGHQLPHLPSFADFWGALDAVFGWLAGPPIVTPPVARAEFGRDLDLDWLPPRGMATWRSGAPIELIRFAGANRLKVAIDYRAEKGRQGLRVVEPYSLRRTKNGAIVLFVVNDGGELRSYRLDRIAGAQVTSESFVPRYLVEF
jgi:predicted nucleotidyltransferase component of viral defense system